VTVPSFQFLALAAAVAIALAFSRAAPWRRAVLFVVNLAFFVSFSTAPPSLAPFAVFLAAGFLAMRLVTRFRNRMLFLVTLALLVLGFCWLKRYAFLPNTGLLPFAYVTVGLSYAFFRVLSVVVDAYQDVLPAPVSPLGFLNYTLNFTSFVSGPIQFYNDFRRDEVEGAQLDRSVAASAIERIVVGFFKVTVLSPVLAYAHSQSLDLSATALNWNLKVLDAVCLMVIFPIYLYVNFSGYTDVVIGTSRFLRLKLPENFNRPFSSRGYLEFWSRWHMSLSNWFKAYVYSPLLMTLMRRYPSRSVEPALGVIAYFVTFFLVGLWHGQSSMFLILGLLMGAGVSGNKLFQLAMVRRLGRTAHQRLCDNPAYASVSAGLTFLWLAVTLVFFWAGREQLAHLAVEFGALAIFAALPIVLLVGAVCYWASSAAVLTAASTQKERSARLLRPAIYAVLATVVVSVAVIFNAPAPHVVYRAF
jgi:D-alanyl-lipoteichoic acid acyltransferase DltB (MBOAT superfamily)